MIMIIRRAEKKDFLAIADLDRKAWSEHPGGEFIPDGEHVWAVWTEQAIIYCAYEGDNLLGAVLAFPTINNAYWLHKAFVSREARGKGVGSKLFEAIIEEIDRLKTDISLTVEPSNANAIALYEKFGFTEKNFVESYYRPGENRYVLTRKARQ